MMVTCVEFYCQLELVQLITKLSLDLRSASAITGFSNRPAAITAQQAAWRRSFSTDAQR